MTSPLSFVASANCLLYEGAQPVFCDIDPVTLDLDPAAAAAAVGERTAGILPGPHLRLPGRDAGARGRSPPDRGLGILEDACEALGAVDAEGRRVGARGNLAAFAFYANKQMTTGEGGMLVPADARDRRARCAASATRAARPTWAGSTTTGLGFNYRLSDVAAAIGVAQVERLDAMLQSSARRSPALYAERLAGGRGRRGPDCPGTAAPSAAAGSSSRSSCPAEADRDAVIAALAERGIASKAYLPCIHLLPPYRERFGFGRASSRSPSASPTARSRCRSSPR